MPNIDHYNKASTSIFVCFPLSILCRSFIVLFITGGLISGNCISGQFSGSGIDLIVLAYACLYILQLYQSLQNLMGSWLEYRMALTACLQGIPVSCHALHMHVITPEFPPFLHDSGFTHVLSFKLTDKVDLPSLIS